MMNEYFFFLVLLKMSTLASVILLRQSGFPTSPGTLIKASVAIERLVRRLLQIFR